MLSKMDEMADHVAGFSDDGVGVQADFTMEDAMVKVASLGKSSLPIVKMKVSIQSHIQAQHPQVKVYKPQEILNSLLKPVVNIIFAMSPQRKH